jgi:hypothetical protein
MLLQHSRSEDLRRRRRSAEVAAEGVANVWVFGRALTGRPALLGLLNGSGGGHCPR